MQEAVKSTSASTDQLAREISRFLNAASKHGNSDLYHNRRTAVRYHRAWPMFAARLDAPTIRDQSVTLHNISAGGIGFFCDEGFPVGSVIGIKLFWSDPCSPRVPAIVKHVQITPEGTLIGAEFAISDHGLRKMIAEKSRDWYG
jgi:hypothetical protein